VVKYACQFCKEVTPVKQWLNKGQTCPKCGESYDSLLAQDSE